MKNLAKILIGFVVVMVMILPVFSIVHATDPLPDYTVLAPLPGTTGTCDTGSTPKIDPATGKTTGGCTTNFNTYLPAMFKLAIGVAAVLAFIMLTYAGVLYMTTDAISGKGKAKGYIENALWGLLLVIGAWVILNTINPQLLSFNLLLPPPQTVGMTAAELKTLTANQEEAVLAQNKADAAVTNAAVGSDSGGKSATGADLLSGQSLAADASNRQTLSNEGVYVKAKACESSNPTSCTDVNNITPGMIDSLGALRANACQSSSDQSKCFIYMTGGNEASLHNTGTAHGNGNTVDLSQTATLNNYLASQNPIAKNPVNNTTVVVNGLTYKFEVPGANAANTGAHWHVTKP